MNPQELLSTITQELLSTISKLQSQLQAAKDQLKQQETNDDKTILIAGMRFTKHNLGTDLDNPYGKYYTWDEAMNAVPNGWRIPTKDEWVEFDNKTTHEWTKQNGIAGMLFTDKENSNQLFLPATGYRSNASAALLDVANQAYYWSSSPGGAYYAYDLYFNSNGNVITSNYDNRSYGLPLRCVQEIQ